jgi:hypothetical protein
MIDFGLSSPDAIIRHVQQPPDSKQCGQACVAMLAGVTLEQVMSTPIGPERKKRLPPRGGTCTGGVIRMLEAQGLYPMRHPRLELIRKGLILPQWCLVLTHWPKWADKPGTHWVCRINGIWHDPLFPSPGTISWDYKPTSYLPLRRLTPSGLLELLP